MLVQKKILGSKVKRILSLGQMSHEQTSLGEFHPELIIVKLSLCAKFQTPSTFPSVEYYVRVLPVILVLIVSWKSRVNALS